jgi:hypothetical protein
MRPADFTTTDIDLAAAIMTAASKKPLAIRPGAHLVEFIFPDDETTQAVIKRYAGNSLLQEVRRFAAHRAWLYRQARDVARGGFEVRHVR